MERSPGNPTPGNSQTLTLDEMKTPPRPGGDAEVLDDGVEHGLLGKEFRTI